MKCVISREHASTRIPPRFKQVFAGREKVLSSHQAYDPGAALLARRLARQLQVSLHLGTISRLLIDLNRSASNRKSLYTPYSRKLPPASREMLLRKYYQPYREKVEGAIAGLVAAGNPVLHISVHTFVPVKNGRIRRADIGLLYDPARAPEKNISSNIVALLRHQVESLQVRRNYPYLGKTDGFTSFLRMKYPATFYAGIEIELNQKLLAGDDRKYRQIMRILPEGIRYLVKYDCFDDIISR